MNFTQEERNQVGIFFTHILSTYYKEPVYYEHVRGHLSKAPEIVRQYILRKCKGEELLKYFRDRKNYFEVEGTYVSLKRKTNVPRYDNPSNVKAKVLKPVKFVRSKSESFSSGGSEKPKASASASKSPEKLEHEEYVLKHFARLLKEGKEVDIESISFEKLPKKVTHFLTVNCDKSLLNYFDRYKELFHVKDKRVFLSKEVLKHSSSSISDIKEVPRENVDSASIGPEQQKAIAWLLSIEYFYKILKKAKGNTLHVDKLAGHLNQAKDCESVKKTVNCQNTLLDFFKLSPALFRVTPSLQVSPSVYFNGVLNQFKNRIYEPSNESDLDTESTLMSSLEDLVRDHGSAADEVEDDANSLGSAFAPESNLSEDKESWKGSVNDHWGTQSESEERESYDDYETDEDCELMIEPYNAEIDYTSYFQRYIERWEDIEGQTCMLDGNSEDIACKDSLDLLPTSSANEIKEKDVSDSSIMELSEQKEAKLKFLFKIQLYCAEAVRNKHEYFKRHEVKCIKFFKQYLKATVGGSTITSLQGSLGQADTEVASFMRKTYKGDKFPLFFQERDEFIIKSLVVTLAPNCEETYKNRLILYANYKKEFSYETLYGSSEYLSFLKVILDFVSEVIKRLNNNKLKCSRIFSLIHKFPSFLESISLNCTTTDEETERFLRVLGIFDILDGLISMSSKNSPISINWLKELTENSLISNLPVEGQSNDDGTPTSDNEDASFELLCEISDYLTEDSSACSVSHYWEAVDLLPNKILLKIGAARADSRIIIAAMVKNGKSLEKHGEVFVHEEKEDFNNEINQKDSNSLENVSLFLNETEEIISLFTNNLEDESDIDEESYQSQGSSMHHGNTNEKDKTEKVEETEKITSQFINNFKDETDINENNRMQGTSIHQRNTHDKDDSEKDSSCEYDTSDCSGPPSLDISSMEEMPFDQQGSLGSEICDGQELVTEVETCINPSCDKIPDSIDSDIPYRQSDPSSDTVKQELSYDFVDSFEKHKSREDSREFVITNVETCDNPACDEIPVRKYSNIPYQQSALSSDIVQQDLIFNSVDSFEKHKSMEGLNDYGLKNIFSSNSDSDLFESIPSSLSIEKIAYKNDGGYSSDVTDCSENMHDTDQNFLKESDSSSVSDLDETSHNLSEVSVLPICNPPLESKTDSADSSNNLETVKCIYKESDLQSKTENKNFVDRSVLQNGSERICSGKSEDCNYAVSEKYKLEFKENESPLILNGCENKSCPEISKFCHSTNPDIKSISVMKAEALSVAKNFFSNFCSCEGICVAGEKLIFHFERKNFLNINKVSNKPKTWYEPTSVETLNKSSFLNQKESVSYDEMGQNHKCKVSKDDKYDVKSQNPLQPIEARIILLTSDSCIAQVISSKKTIYFLKCVFSCDGEHCCSDCFNLLKIGDHISCFVPIPELSRKVWIPIMVSRDWSWDFNGPEQINEVLQNQKVEEAYRKCEVGYQLPRKIVPNLENVSVQTEDKIVNNQNCQTELVTSDAYSQTDLSGEVARDVASCQTEPVPVEDAYVQVGCDTISSGFQTELSYLNATNNESQTDITGSVKECVNSEMSFCQTNISGEIKEMVEVVDKNSQTIATGPVFSQQFYHL